MSHITEVNVVIRDIEALEAAAAACGLVFHRDQRTYRWYGRYLADSDAGRRFVSEHGESAIGRCDHAIGLADATPLDYEIGVCAEPDGSYRLVYDTWGPGKRLEAKAGPDLRILRREYAYHAAKRAARKHLRGWSALRTDMPDGRIVLRFRK